MPSHKPDNSAIKLSRVSLSTESDDAENDGIVIVMIRKSALLNSEVIDVTLTLHRLVMSPLSMCVVPKGDLACANQTP